MADFTLRASQRFPVGTTVEVYLETQKRADAAPEGAAITSAAMDADGEITFTGLTAGTRHVAYASVGGEHRYVGFVPGEDTAGWRGSTGAAAAGGSVSVDFTDVLEALISQSTAADNQIVAAPGAGFRIRVLSFLVIVDGPTQLDWKSGVGGPVKCGPLNVIANGGSAYSGSYPIFSCDENDALVLDSSLAVVQGGAVTYIIEAV